MDFGKYLKNTAKELDKIITETFKQQLERAKKTDKKLVPLLKAFTKSCRGGKRIRGVLVKLGYEIGRQAIGNRLQVTGKEIVKIGAAYEILHAAVLVHDDIIDQSLMRRDQPSLYQALGDNHHGVSQAISLADYGFFLSVNIIAGANFPDKNANQALKLFSQVMMDTAWGQLLDVAKADPQVVRKLKTAYYTISGPLQLGAILAGAGERQIKALGEFGENLGIAFQIKDDILDGEVDCLGGVDNAKKEAEKYISQAMKVIPQITGGTNRAKDPKLSIILEQMGEYLVERNK